MRNRKQEKVIQIILVITTIVMTILRFLLNEKGRVNPDSIRYQRFANLLPEIDNTVTPVGYPFAIKFFTIFGMDEFWSSKLIGILSYLFIIFFAWKKKFYFRETVVTTALFSYVSIFSYTMSEPLILPFVFLLLYVSRNTIVGVYPNWKSILYLSIILIALYNIRYSALFFVGACFLFGALHMKKNYGKPFLISGIIGFLFIVIYKFTFIDYFNENYVDQWLDIGLHPTSKLLIELFQGLATSFNPFIHIADPNGGFINYGIYGIGVATIVFGLAIFVKIPVSETQKFMIFIGIAGIVCSFFIQYFYSVNPIDYRLLSPFILSIWLVFFKKIFQIFGKLTYLIAFLSLSTGFVFTYLSRANYLENRKIVKEFLVSEDLMEEKITYYLPGYDGNENLRRIQVAEIISTINPRVYITHEPKDTLKKNALTEHRVVSKIKIKQNKFQ